MKTKSNWQKPIAIKLYKSIKITMSQKGITQVMLASKMGIEKGNMWKILNSLKRGKLPSFNVIKELEKILEIKIITFFLIKKPLKTDKEKKMEELGVLVKNEFIDIVSFAEYDKKMIMIMFAVLHKYQKNQNSVDFDLSELKSLIGEQRKSKQEISGIIRKFMNFNVKYRANKVIVENEKRLKIKEGDEIIDRFFSRLIITGDNKIIFEIVDHWKDFFVNIQKQFVEIKLQDLEKLKKSSINLYLYFIRWRSYNKEIELKWESFKHDFGFSKGYKDGDILISLNKSLAEIKLAIDLEITFRIEKQWNTKTKIFFKVKDNRKLLKQEELAEKVYSNKYQSTEFNTKFERYLKIRTNKKLENTELDIEVAIKKLEKVDNEAIALEMLENSILSGYPNIYELKGEYYDKKSSRTVKKEYKESTYDRLKRERDEKLAARNM